jgi:predicted lipoprotein with Yx(FWY)xxD motif
MIRTDIRRSASRRLTLAAVAMAAAAVLAACGSSSTNTAGTTASGSGSGDGEAETIGTASGDHGTYLTADDGRAVYLWMADKGSASSCSGACAAVWPPVLTDGAPKASQSAVAADLGTLTRSDGKTQVTYQGHPLYYFASDTKAGQTNGQGSDGFGAKWWLLDPTGAAITSDDAASSPAGNSNGY